MIVRLYINGILDTLFENGNIKTAQTNHCGYFRFEDIEVVQILIINAFHKSYQFNPQVISLDGSITGMNIMPQ